MPQECQQLSLLPDVLPAWTKQLARCNTLVTKTGALPEMSSLTTKEIKIPVLSGIRVEVKAKPQHHKFLIGRAGVHVQKIRDETGAGIIFPGANDANRESITIIGTKEAVEAAKVIVEARVKELENIVEGSMTVDPKHHRHFVARRGEVLRRIGDEFGGVVVSFPRNGVAGDKVNLKGARNCIDVSIARINEIL